MTTSSTVPHEFTSNLTSQPNTTRARVLLGDSQVMLLDGLRRLLSEEFDIVGTAENGIELVEQAEALQPDLVVFEIDLPHSNGIEVVREIEQKAPQANLVVLTTLDGAAYVEEAFRKGVRGFVSKRSAARELATTLWEVLRGRSFVARIPGSLERVTETKPFAGEKLTTRQREVLQLVAEGKRNKEIAAILRVSLKTVEFHKASLMERVGVTSVAMLTRFALSHGFVA